MVKKLLKSSNKPQQGEEEGGEALSKSPLKEAKSKSSTRKKKATIYNPRKSKLSVFTRNFGRPNLPTITLRRAPGHASPIRRTPGTTVAVHLPPRVAPR